MNTPRNATQMASATQSKNTNHYNRQVRVSARTAHSLSWTTLLHTAACEKTRDARYLSEITITAPQFVAGWRWWLAEVDWMMLVWLPHSGLMGTARSLGALR